MPQGERFIVVNLGGKRPWRLIDTQGMVGKTHTASYAREDRARKVATMLNEAERKTT